MNLTDLRTHDQESSDIYDGSPVPKETFHIFSLTVILLGGGIALFGLTFNTINIAVFYRQGPLSNSSTVILMGLAVSDFLVCFLSIIQTILICIEILVDVSEWSWEIGYFFPIVLTRPLIYAFQITCLLTTFVTIERAVSVTFPFKVKAIFTPNRSLIIVVMMFVLAFIIHIPNFMEYEATFKVRPHINASYVTFVLSDTLPQSLQTVYYFTSPVFLRFGSMLLLITCNVVIFWKVKLSQKFRKSNANAPPSSSSQPNTQSVSKESTSQETTHNAGKEMKLLRMIVVISLVFCFCYTLSVIQNIVFFLVYDYGVDYHWVTQHMTYQASLVFQVLNSSINFVIYCRMSSRFKEELDVCCSKIKISMSQE